MVAVLPTCSPAAADGPLVLDGSLDRPGAAGRRPVWALWTARRSQRNRSQSLAACTAFFGAGAQVRHQRPSYQANVGVRRGWMGSLRRPTSWSVAGCGSRRGCATSSRGPAGSWVDPRRSARTAPPRRRVVPRSVRRAGGSALRLPRTAAPKNSRRPGRTCSPSDHPGRRRGPAVLVALLEESACRRGSASRCSARRPADPAAAGRVRRARRRSRHRRGRGAPDQVDVLDAVRTAVAVTGLPAVAYPTARRQLGRGHKRWVYGDPASTLALVGDWLSAGVRLVGGCCGHRAHRRRGAGPAGGRP